MTSIALVLSSVLFLQSFCFGLEGSYYWNDKSKPKNIYFTWSKELITETDRTEANPNSLETHTTEETTSDSNYTGEIYTPPSTTDADEDDHFCPPEKSRHTSEDISTIIEYVYDRDSYESPIKDSYTWKACIVADSHLKTINNFREWLTERPNHLKHVLEELVDIRTNYVEPITEKVINELKENPRLEKQFEERLHQAKSLFDELEEAEQICKIRKCPLREYDNTPKTEINSRGKRSIPDEFYCSSIEDLHAEIEAKLSNAAKQIQDSAPQRVDILDNEYTRKIQDIIAIIKEAALSKFGSTMYDILNLQDEYHHFRKEILTINVNMNTFSVKDLGTQIDRKLLELQQSVKSFAQYCDSCKKVKPTTTTVLFKPLLLSVTEVEKKPNIVDALIKLKKDAALKDIQRDLDSRFSKLEAVVRDTENVNNFLSQLKLIKEEIANLTNDEKQALENLRLRLPKSLIMNLFALVHHSQDLLREIEDGLHRSQYSVDN